MKRHPWKRILSGVAFGLVLAMALIGFIVFHLVEYYYYSIGSMHNPADYGYTPVQEVTEAKGGFVMRRYRIKGPLLQKVLSGNPHQSRDDGYDSVIVISDLSGDMIARISHWEGNPTIVVTPAGITGPSGIVWKAAP